MTTLDAVILGIVQGLTEFLPISSSGHLQLIQSLLGMKDLDQYLVFDLICHLGTLCAILILFFQQIKSTCSSLHSTRLRQLAIGTLPLFPLVLIMKPIKAVYASPEYLGTFFILTSLILFLGIWIGKRAFQTQEHPWRDAWLIGCWQAVAIFPGISRSGSTISGARMLGWNPQDAVSFSFLLAIPAILGGVALEIFKMWKHPQSVISLPFSHYVLGFFFSFVIGLFALQLLMRLAMQNRFSYFAWYCLILGVATTYYFHIYSG